MRAHQEGAPPPEPPPEPSPEQPPVAPPGPPTESGGASEGVRRDTAELADMLKDIGASLQGLDSTAADSTAADAPAIPASPDPPPDLPWTGPEPPAMPETRQTSGAAAGPPPGPPPGQPINPSADDEAGLLEILGRMGPSAEERRTAARLMKRLFKGRAARRGGEPGDDDD